LRGPAGGEKSFVTNGELSAVRSLVDTAKKTKGAGNTSDRKKVRHMGVRLEAGGRLHTSRGQEPGTMACDADATQPREKAPARHVGMISYRVEKGAKERLSS